MFVTPAYAQGRGASPDMFDQHLPFVMIFVIMYFLIIRPQQTQLKKRIEMLAEVRRGDTVVTAGGLIGKVTKVIDDDEPEIEVGEHKVRRCARRSPTCASRASPSPTRTPRNNRIRAVLRDRGGELFAA